MTENSAGRERWEVDADPRPHTRWGMNLQVLDAEAGTTVCFVANSSRGAGSEARGQENYRRAHLIAAAPELYETLKECADEMEGIIRANHGLEAGEDGGKRFERDMTLVRAAREALARARGDSPEVKP